MHVAVCEHKQVSREARVHHACFGTFHIIYIYTDVCDCVRLFVHNTNDSMKHPYTHMCQNNLDYVCTDSDVRHIDTCLGRRQMQARANTKVLHVGINTYYVYALARTIVLLFSSRRDTKLALDLVNQRGEIVHVDYRSSRAPHIPGHD